MTGLLLPAGLAGAHTVLSLLRVRVLSLTAGLVDPRFGGFAVEQTRTCCTG